MTPRLKRDSRQVNHPDGTRSERDTARLVVALHDASVCKAMLTEVSELERARYLCTSRDRTVAPTVAPTLSQGSAPNKLRTACG